MSRYIDADALIEGIANKFYDEASTAEAFDMVNKVCDYITDAPSIEPKRGEWISLHNGKWKCSECGIEVLIYAKGNFCPNCGADMRGKGDD